MKGEKINEGKIRELFDLCVRISNETSAYVSFDYTAKDDESSVYIYIFNDEREIIKHFILTQFYDFGSEAENYENAKNIFWRFLSMGGAN